MIISSYTELKIGKMYGLGDGDELSDYNGKYHEKIPFLVLRIVTKQEWIDFCNSQNAKIRDMNRDFYYEVSVD